jgi:pyridoxine kinase
MQGKKILTVQDLSCVGQCSLTVALPVLSHYGVEAAILPTAVLSNHTMFKSWSYLDLTDEIPNIYENWKKNGVTFSGFLLGYLGKQSIMALCERAFDEFAEEGAPIIIDPVMGDNGKLYSGFNEAYVQAMRCLIKRADIILPNLTEVSYLVGEEYTENYDRDYIERIIRKLGDLTSAVVIITGVELDGKIGEAILKDGKVEYVLSRKVPIRAHGTGDIFAAAFTAHYLTGKSLADSCARAGDLVVNCLDITPREHFYGVCFEDVLKGECK